MVNLTEPPEDFYPIMTVADLTPEEREELYQNLLANRMRLEDHLQLSKEGLKLVDLSSGAVP
jgi:hypothetical protein